MKPPVILAWLPTGECLSGASASSVLSALAARQWAPMSVEKLKVSLARRVAALGRPKLNPALDDEEFLVSAHEQKLLRLDRVPGKGQS